MTAPIKPFNLNIGPIHAHAFNADRTKVALSAGTEIVFIYGEVGGQWVKQDELTGHDMAVTSIDWAPKTNRIVSCSQDKNAYVWTLENGKWNACLVLARLNFAATCVKWSPSENKFAVGSSQKIVSICHYEADNNWWVAKHIKNPIVSTVQCIDWHPGNVLLAIGSYDFKARVFSAFVKEVDAKPDPNPWGSKMSFGNLMAEYKSSGWVKAIAFSPSGHRMAWVAHDSTINVVDAIAGVTNVVTYFSNELPLKTMCWTSDEAFVTAGFNCMPYLFEFTNGQIKRCASLDVQAESKSAATNNPAFQMFKKMDRLGLREGATNDTAAQTVHQNCISQILPFKRNGPKITSFSTVGFDSKLVIWPIKST